MFFYPLTAKFPGGTKVFQALLFVLFDNYQNPSIIEFRKKARFYVNRK